MASDDAAKLIESVNTTALAVSNRRVVSPRTIREPAFDPDASRNRNSWLAQGQAGATLLKMLFETVAPPKRALAIYKCM